MIILRFRSTFSSVLLAVATMCASQGARAQSPSSSDESLPVVPFAERTYARFTSGDECALAHQWLEAQYWRDKRPDTLSRPAPGAPFQPSTDSVIAQCVARLSPTGTAERDLIGVADADLAAGRLKQADSVFDDLSRRAAKESVQTKARAYMRAVLSYLSAPLPDLKGAQAYLGKLDAMAAPAAIERMVAHSAAAGEAQRRDSVALWDRELRAALAASKEIVGDARKQFAPEAAMVYAGIAQLRARQGDAAGAQAILTEGRSELLPLRPGVAGALSDWTVRTLGQPAQPLQATKWANGGPDGMVHPIKGRPALIVFYASANAGSFDYEDYGVLHRLIAAFPSPQVDFVIVTHTEGYSRGRLVSPDSEMDITSDYFLNFLKFPVAVSLWKGVYDERVDGQFIMEKPSIEKSYDPPRFRHLTAGLVDKDGKIRLYTTLERQNEIMLRDVLKSLL